MKNEKYGMGGDFNSEAFARDARPQVTILPAGQTARNEFGHRYGSQQATLTKEQINALLAGQQLAVEIMDGEYVLFISADQ